VRVTALNSTAVIIQNPPDKSYEEIETAVSTLSLSLTSLGHRLCSLSTSEPPQAPLHVGVLVGVTGHP